MGAMPAAFRMRWTLTRRAVRIPLKAISHSGVFDQVLSEAAERPTQRSDQPLKITSFENNLG